MLETTTSAGAKPRDRATLITDDDLMHLPAPVQRYLRHTGVVGKPWVETVSLKYTGKFRMGADKPWMGVNVAQFYATNPPGFWWKARFRMFGLPLLRASDTYKNGHSRMVGKLAGLMTVVDGQGPEIDQGTMVRYLQEMTWFPAGYLGDNMRWESVDDHAADVTFTDGGKSVTGRMFFDDLGRIINFAAQRYGDFGGKPVIKTWTTPMTEYAPINGLNIPVAGNGVWLLPEGDFTYITVRVTELVYNAPLPAW